MHVPVLTNTHTVFSLFPFSTVEINGKIEDEQNAHAHAHVSEVGYGPEQKCSTVVAQTYCDFPLTLAYRLTYEHLLTVHTFRLTVWPVFLCFGHKKIQSIFQTLLYNVGIVYI